MKKPLPTKNRKSLTFLNATQRLMNEREKLFPIQSKLKKTTRDFCYLSLQELYHRCDEQLAEAAVRIPEKPNYDIISQPRAVRAIDLGLGINKSGYNIYVAGEQGTGRTSVIRSFLHKTSAQQPSPDDWIYVYNFKNPESPQAISMPKGQAKHFRKQMDELIVQLTRDLLNAFQSEDYETKVNAVINTNNEKKSKLFNELEKSAKSKSFGVKSTHMGIVTVPIVEGNPLSEKDYAELSDEAKEKIEAERNTLEPEVLDFARRVRVLEHEAKETLDSMQTKLADYVLNEALLPLQKEYEQQTRILAYLQDVKKHVVENIGTFLPEEDEAPTAEGGEDESEVTLVQVPGQRKGDPYLSYRINVFVDNTDVEGAPIIIENNPTFYNLFGKIEKNIEYGVYTTDFKMIKAGALAQANGGYLVLNALDVFRTPQVWETLKRVIKNQKLYIEDLGEQFSILATSGLRPEPIPLNVKIVLIGSEWIYRRLYQFDEDFSKIFKIKAEFDSQMERNEETMMDYVNFIHSRARLESLLPFSQDAACSIIEFGSRAVDNQNKLTTRFGVIKDIVVEADFMARERQALEIAREDVEKAIDERYLRSSAVEDYLLEMLQKGDLMISTKSRRIGEMNGLAVYSLGDLMFGVPTRITCRTYKGKPGIINIERDASLSGRIHNKGMSILTSWIHATFARKTPVTVSASICFEQNYSGVDGDSASLAELCLILATLAGLPIDQGLAVTGSVNQFGEVQPIGGVNEKIEGFFKVCRMQGLTGKQGCVIPVQNVKHLMLHRSVREACEKGLFHIWSVSSVEEAFELLTGFAAGQWDDVKKRFELGGAFAEVYKAIRMKGDKPKKAKEVKKKTKVVAKAVKGRRAR